MVLHDCDPFDQQFEQRCCSSGYNTSQIGSIHCSASVTRPSSGVHLAARRFPLPIERSSAQFTLEPLQFRGQKAVVLLRNAQYGANRLLRLVPPAQSAASRATASSWGPLSARSWISR